MITQMIDCYHLSYKFTVPQKIRSKSYISLLSICGIVIPKPYQTLLCPSTSPTYSGNCTFAGIINAINIPPPTYSRNQCRKKFWKFGGARDNLRPFEGDFFVLILPKSEIGDCPIALPALVTVPTALTTVLVQFPKGPKHPPWPNFQLAVHSKVLNARWLKPSRLVRFFYKNDQKR